MILEKLNQRLSNMNMTVADLDERGKHKYKELKYIVDSKLKSLRNEDGTLKPNQQNKVKYLIQDIIEIAESLKEDPTTTPDPTPDPTPDTTPDPTPDPKPKKGSGFLFGLLD